MMKIDKKYLDFKKIKRKLHEILYPYKKSYSQTGEDLIVNFIFKERGILYPSYIDIGAFNPTYINNTKLFYNKGCCGINIEPNISAFRKFIWRRHKDINLNIGISDKSGKLKFYVMSSPTLNTFSKTIADELVEEHGVKIKEIRTIPVFTVKEIIDKYCHGKFPDFLSIDTEGEDERIIKSIDFNIAYPKVICVETITYSTTGRGIKETSIIDFLKNKGYIVYADTNINTILVRRDFWELSII